MLDANTALLLCWIGLLLIAAEFCLPGWVWPGVTGGVLLVCGAYRLAWIGISPGAAVALFALLGIAVVGGYRCWPLWCGIAVAAGVAGTSVYISPDALIHWLTGLAGGLLTLLLFVLNRLAGRSAAQKHNLSRLF